MKFLCAFLYPHLQFRDEVALQGEGAGGDAGFPRVGNFEACIAHLHVVDREVQGQIRLPTVQILLRRESRESLRLRILLLIAISFPPY